MFPQWFVKPHLPFVMMRETHLLRLKAAKHSGWWFDSSFFFGALLRHLLEMVVYSSNMHFSEYLICHLPPLLSHIIWIYLCFVQFACFYHLTSSDHFTACPFFFFSSSSVAHFAFLCHLWGETGEGSWGWIMCRMPLVTPRCCFSSALPVSVEQQPCRLTGAISKWECSGRNDHQLRYLC